MVEKFGRTTSRFWSFWSSISETTKLLNYVISKNDLQKSKVYSLDPIQFQGEPKELSKVLMSLANSPSTKAHSLADLFCALILRFHFPKKISFRCKHWLKFVKLFKANIIQKNLRFSKYFIKYNYFIQINTLVI